MVGSHHTTEKQASPDEDFFFPLPLVLDLTPRMLTTLKESPAVPPKSRCSFPANNRASGPRSFFRIFQLAEVFSRERLRLSLFAALLSPSACEAGIGRSSEEVNAGFSKWCKSKLL